MRESNRNLTSIRHPFPRSYPLRWWVFFKFFSNADRCMLAQHACVVGRTRVVVVAHIRTPKEPPASYMMRDAGDTGRSHGIYGRASYQRASVYVSILRCLHKVKCCTRRALLLIRTETGRDKKKKNAFNRLARSRVNTRWHKSEKKKTRKE